MSLRRWRLTATIAVHGLILLHLFLWYGLNWREVGYIGMPEFYRTFIQRGILNAGGLFFLLLLASSLLWGRMFCGWLCHIGQLYDLLEPLYRRFAPRKPRSLRFGIPFAAAILLWYFLGPALLIRLRDGAPPGPGVDFAETSPWQMLPGWQLGLLTFFLVLVALPLAFGPRAFCRLLCPWGVSLAWSNWLSRFRIRKVNPCTRCGACTRACPMGIDVARAIDVTAQVKSPACTQCMACLEVCDSHTLAFADSRHMLPADHRLPPPRREARAPELLFWALTALVGLIYSELYGFGIFIGFCLGVLLAHATLTAWQRLPQAKWPMRAAWGTVLLLCWSVTAKDGLAHWHFRAGLASFRTGQMVTSQSHLERADALFWHDPTELYLKLYIIYKQSGQKEKQQEIRDRYEERRTARRKEKGLVAST